MTELTRHLVHAEKCPNCGAKMKKHWQRLSPGLVHSLIKFAKVARNKQKIAVHLRDEVKLDSVAYNNFNKLKYWGLVKRSERKSGKWELTDRGVEFLNNRLLVPVRVQTFRNRVVDRDKGMVCISEIITGYPSDYWQTEFGFEIKESRLVPVAFLDRTEQLSLI